MSKKLLVFIGLIAGSTAGWYLGNLVGTMTGYFLSLFGAAGGMIGTRLLLEKYLG